MARRMRNVGNRDANEPEIVAEFERLGFYVIRMPRDAGFDLLCLGEDNIKMLVEVKNPEYSAKLTEKEIEFLYKCQSKYLNTGVLYTN